MSYTLPAWADRPALTSPINSANLGLYNTAINDLDARIGRLTTPVALTDAATITVDASLGNIFAVTLGGSRTMANPTNSTDGQQILFRIRQDGTGLRLLTWSSAYTFGTDVTAAPTLSATANRVDYITCIYSATDSHWHMLSYERGYN